MTLGVYLFPVLMFAFVTYLAIRVARELRAEWRTDARIGEIARDQARGVTERITERDLSERRR